MLASDLPVTEYWDPHWDVYDVPLCPQASSDPAWWPAYEHQWLVGWIMDGSAPYIPANFQHQLTGG
jgi:hypothetical protein